MPVKCEVHYTNRCDEKVAWKCDIRCSGGFVPRVSLVMSETACPVCWQICLCIRQSVKDYPGLPSSSVVLYDDHYKRTWLGESHVLPHLRINNSAAAFRPIFKWNAWFTRYVTNCSRNLLTPVSLRQLCTMMPTRYSRRIGRQYRCLLLITPALPTRSFTVFFLLLCWDVSQTVDFIRLWLTNVLPLRSPYSRLLRCVAPNNLRTLKL